MDHQISTTKSTSNNDEESSPGSYASASSAPDSAEGRPEPAAARGVSGAASSPFEAFYLRQVAAEFANDLDQLRGAPDFHGDRSLPLLIRALQQGTACFSATEQAQLAAGAAADATREDPAK